MLDAGPFFRYNGLTFAQSFAQQFSSFPSIEPLLLVSSRSKQVDRGNSIGYSSVDGFLVETTLQGYLIP